MKLVRNFYSFTSREPYRALYVGEEQPANLTDILDFFDDEDVDLRDVRVEYGGCGTHEVVFWIDE